MSKRNDLFNPLFKGFRPKIKTGGSAELEREELKKTVPNPPPKQDEPTPDEFLEAMSGVKPLPKDAPKRVRPGGTRLSPASPAPDERREVIGHLQGLVKGAIEMDITFTDEYIEGSVRGFNRDLMRKLK